MRCFFMQKILILLILFILILNTSYTIYADDEIDESGISQEELQEILEISIDVTKIPSINSRHAIVYDRTSRRNTIW